jgi:hypothetical protein
LLEMRVVVKHAVSVKPASTPSIARIRQEFNRIDFATSE